MAQEPKRTEAEYADGAAEFDDIPEFVPRMDMREIFQGMIAHELRNGRLTSYRRRRIVRYAARLGLSAVEAGRFIAACREAALESGDPVERHHALRLADPPSERTLRPHAITLAVIGAILIDVLLMAWLW